MKIFNPDGTDFLAKVVITANARHEQELMKSDFVSLEWNDDTYRSIPSGAYILHNDIKYTLFEEYEPENNSGVYVYKPEFQSPAMILGKTPCLFKTNNVSGGIIYQTDWVYTGNLPTIVGRIVQIIEEQIGTHLEPIIQIKSTTSLPASATCTFSGVDIISALNEICSQFGGLDWHIEWDGDIQQGGYLYVGDITSGGDAYEIVDGELEPIDPPTPIELAEGGNVQFASVNKNGEAFANYFVVRGGTRNITIQTQSEDKVQTDTRLELNSDLYPNSAIDKRTDKINEPKIQKVLIFDNVYPKLDLYVYNVRKRTRYLCDSETGKPIPNTYDSETGLISSYKKYSVYYMKLAYPTNEAKTEWEQRYFDKKNELVAGRKLTCSFEPNEKGTHSQLAGREFELFYHETAQTYPEKEHQRDTRTESAALEHDIEDSGVGIEVGDFEIIFQQDDDFIIPNDNTLEPWGEENAPTDECDIVVLFNVVMNPTYITQAQTALHDAAENEISRIRTDNNNYTVKSNPIAFNTSNPNLKIGSNVDLTLQNGTIMNTRVIKLVTNIDYPCQQEITIGNAVIKGSTQSLKEEVKSLTAAVDINETSATTINKMISQLYRALREFDTLFIHKDQPDATPFSLGAESIDVEHGAVVGGNLTVGAEDIPNNIYPALKVFANLLKTELGGALQTENYSKSMVAGTGWGVDHAGNMQVESLEVRSALRVLELVYNRLSAEESDFVFTEGGTIENVEYIGTVEGRARYLIKIQKRSDTDFHAFRKGDVLRGIVNDLADLGGGQYFTSWLHVEKLISGENSIIVSMYLDGEVPSGYNYVPKEHMVIHRWGNSVTPDATTKADPDYSSFIELKGDEWINRRQSCWYISSIEKRITMLDHVFQPKLNEGNYAAFFGLPFNLSTFKGHSMDESQPYLYVRGAFLQDIHFINYLGKEYKVERDRGEWSAETAASEDDPYIVDYATYQTVTWNNCKWECVSEVPAVNEPSTDNTSEWKLLKENIVPPVYTLITNVKNVIRDSEGTPNVDVVKCLVRKTLDEATTNDTQNQLGYLYYSINGGNMRRGSSVNLAQGDGIKTIRFVFYPRKTNELGGARMGQSRLGMAQIEAIVDVLDEARGITLRGPSRWEVGKEYQGGGENDEYQDIVICDEYPNQMYLCKVTHTSSQSTYPPTHSKNAEWDTNDPWTQTEYREFTATKVLFANRGKIENADITNVTIRGTITEDCITFDDDIHTVLIAGSSVEGEEGQLQSVQCAPCIRPNEDNVLEWDWQNQVINNQIIQLPTYKKIFVYNFLRTREIQFHSNPYKIAGTKLSIFTTPDITFLNWADGDFTDRNDWVKYIFNEGVLVCADPNSLLGEIKDISGNQDGSQMRLQAKCPWNWARLVNREGTHGRFLFKGRTARFAILLPGMHLDLESQIQYMPKLHETLGYEVAEPTLVWNILNTADFEPININLYVKNRPNVGENAYGEGSYYEDPSTATGGGMEGGQEVFVCNRLKGYEDMNISLDVTLAGCFKIGDNFAEQEMPSWEANVSMSNNQNS